jgi:hypothetical protein
MSTSLARIGPTRDAFVMPMPGGPIGGLYTLSSTALRLADLLEEIARKPTPLSTDSGDTDLDVAALRRKRSSQ